MDQTNHSKTKKNELRTCFKKCFKNPIFSLVPFEVWRDFIVSNADVQSLTLLAQTCHAFKEIVDNIGENNFNLALIFRKECQIDLAKKYLLLCANKGNSVAMFQLGYAFRFSGWGFTIDARKSIEWLKKSAELVAHAMASYAFCLKCGAGVKMDDELCKIWAQKALSSNNSFAIGYCHHFSVGTARDCAKSFDCFEASSKEGDEFGQYYFGRCLFYGQGTERNDERALFWFLKSAEQGFCLGQHHVGKMYREGLGCVKDNEKAIIWYKKAAKQGHENSKNALKEMEVKI